MVGTPVATSDASCLPEIAGGAAILFDPKDPADSALIPEPPPVMTFAGPVAIVAFGLLFAGAGSLAEHCPLFFAALFIGVGLVMCRVGWKWGRRVVRSRGFPSVTGRLLKAEIVCEIGGADYEITGTGERAPGRGGFVPLVEFEYEVSGTRYRSQQVTALNARALKARVSDAQPLVDMLRADPEPRVYYDPRAPWDGFLQHGPAWGVYGPILPGLAFAGFGVALGISVSRP